MIRLAGPCSAALSVLGLLLPGCSHGPPSCAAGQELFEDRCVDPGARYEPDERVDQDNVVAFGDPLTVLDLPEPPRSGFRIIAPPRRLEPGEEAHFCLSWPYPSVRHKLVYAARVYTTVGLHHSNVIAKPIDPEVGPNPYPSCHPGASDPFGDLPEIIPDVLFASSTQVVGQEVLAFPPGMGFRIDTSREISTDMHLLNTAGEPAIVEVAYDFFTMPEEQLGDEIVPFVMSVNEFLVPPHATEAVGATCPAFGGNVVSLMPHTHQYAEKFEVDVLGPTGSAERIYEDGSFDLESDISILDPSVPLTLDNSIRFQCTFHNTSEHDLVFGLGDNEMCILFGYLYPPEQQFVSFSENESEPCMSFQIGLLR